MKEIKITERGKRILKNINFDMTPEVGAYILRELNKINGWITIEKFHEAFMKNTQYDDSLENLASEIQYLIQQMELIKTEECCERCTRKDALEKKSGYMYLLCLLCERNPGRIKIKDHFKPE